MNGYYELLVMIIDHNSNLPSVEDEIKKAQTELAQIKEKLDNQINDLALGALDKAFFMKSVSKLLSVNQVNLRMSRMWFKPTNFLDWDELVKLDKNIRVTLSQIAQQDLGDAWVAFNQSAANLIFKIKKKTAGKFTGR